MAVEKLVPKIVMNLLAAVFGSIVTRYLLKKHLIPVDIKMRKVAGPQNSGVRPKVLVLTFSGCRKPEKLSQAEFEAALRRGDLDQLPLSEATPAIGHTVRSLLTYRASLAEAYLITSDESHASVPLLKAFAERERLGVGITARPEETLVLDDDMNVTERAFEVTRELILHLRKSWKPAEILVDVTGGTRSMTTGALLACLIPNQDVQVIAAPYTPEGRPIGEESYPMVIKFKPDLRALKSL